MKDTHDMQRTRRMDHLRATADRGQLAVAVVVAALALVLVTLFTVAVVSNVKRTQETNSDIAITQRTDAAVAAAVARLSGGQTLPATRDAATVSCEKIDNRSTCYAYWALPRPGNAADPLRYDLITQSWDDSKLLQGKVPTDGTHVRTVRVPLEAVTYQGEPVSSNGRIVYQATPAGLFSNALFSFRETTINGPDVVVRSYNSVSATSGTDNGTVASGGWVSYGRTVDVDSTRLYGTGGPGTDRTTRCTGEPCDESDVTALPHSYALADDASVAWMRDGANNPAVACTSTVDGNWVASERGARIVDGVLCINGSFIVDVPTIVDVPKATIVVHGNILVQRSLNAPGASYQWANPARLSIYSTGRAVTFDPREPAGPGVAVSALVYAPRAMCSTDPANRKASVSNDFTGAITYSGSLVCDTISLGGSWTHAYDDAVPVNFVDPVASARKAWVIGAPDVVNPNDWEVPVGWQDPTCVPPRPSSATSWWRLTEPSGSVAADSASNNNLGWLTTDRGEGICASSKGAKMASVAAASSSSTIRSATNGATLEWWGKGTVGKITAGGMTVTIDSTRHVLVNAGGTNVKFPFTVENHNEWHLYAVTVSSTGAATLYVDGVQKKTATTGSPSAGGTTSVGPGTAGSVSEVVLYSRVLSLSEVQQRWAAWNSSVYFSQTNPGTPFGAPTLSDNGTTYGQLRVRWTAPSGTFPTGTLTKYEVQSSTSATGTFATIGTIDTPTTTWNYSSPQTGERWYRACAVYNGDRVCGGAVSIIAIPQLTAPTVTVSNVTTTTARFDWSSVQYAARYEHQYRTNNSGWVGPFNGTEAARYVNHGPTTQGTVIEVQVRGIDAYGQPGPWSAVAQARLGIDPPAVNGWQYSYSFPNMYARVVRDNGASRICPSGTVVRSQYTDKLTVWTNWNGWRGWVDSSEAGATAWHASTVGAYDVGADQAVNIVCANPYSGLVSAVSGTHFTTLYHSIPAPWGAWAGVTSYRTAGWGAACVDGTQVQYVWRVEAAFGVVADYSWVTYTSWSNPGQAWGRGTVYMSARCVAGGRAGPEVGAAGGFG